jgi:hypothetical protein
MLWPLELPVRVAFWILVAFVLMATLCSGRWKWKPGKTFMTASLLAVIGFIPSCTLVMKIIDGRRFGIFEYDSYEQVQDFRIERYLPPAARNITLEKTYVGHRAKYTISESELKSYVDGLWAATGESSVISRSDLEDGGSAQGEETKSAFQGLDWPRIREAIRFCSPVESDGGGAKYFFDRTTGIAYHRGSYW